MSGSKDNAKKGIVRDVTEQIGGIVDNEPLAFTSTNRDANRALFDETELARIVAVHRHRGLDRRAAPLHERAAGGRGVGISDLPLAQRVTRIEAQDGIMVGRPLGRE